MKQHDERIYRKPSGKPTLQALRSQLARCREDYERFAGKETAVDLRIALRAKIAALEAEIAQTVKADAQAKVASETADDDADAEPAAVTSPGGPSRAAGTRAVQPRFRPRR